MNEKNEKHLYRQEFWRQIATEADSFVNFLSELKKNCEESLLHENDIACFKKINALAKDLQCLAGIAYITRYDDVIRNVYRPELKQIEASEKVDFTAEAEPEETEK